MNGNVYKFTAGPDDDGRRIDRIIRKLRPDLPLSAIYKLIRKGYIKINGKKCKQDTIIINNDVIELELKPQSALNDTSKKISDLKNHSLHLNSLLVYENDDIAIINKPRGIVTHGTDSIASNVLTEFKRSPSLSFTPAPLHRLDRNTSGLLIISKTLNGARKISKAIQEHVLEKHYLAIIEGTLKDKQVWIDYLIRDTAEQLTRISALAETGSEKRGILELFPLVHNNAFTLVDIKLVTGFTHQIRSQCAARGFPLAGDKKYGSSASVPYYFLHAWAIKNIDTILPDSLPLITAFPDKSQITFISTYFQLEIPQKNEIIASIQK